MSWLVRIRLATVFICALSFALLTMPPESVAQVKLDDIDIYYHGAVFDKQGKQITINDENARTLFGELAGEAQKDKRCESKPAKQVCDFLNRARASDLQSQIDLLDFGIDALIEENSNDPVYQQRMLKKLKMLRSMSGRTRQGELKFPTELDDALAVRYKKFAKSKKSVDVKCDFNKVPRPPGYLEFLNSKMHQKVIPEHSMMQHISPKEFHATDVYFQAKPTSSGKSGVCALLKRYESGVPEAGPKIPLMIAAICQNEESGEACFWQANLDGQDSTEKTKYLQDHDDIAGTWPMGSGYSDNCTACHSGNNAFVQYKGNKPCFKENYGDPESQCYRGYKGTTTALGFELESTTKLENPSSTCTSCHTLETTNTEEFCKILVFVTKAKLMPPGSTEAIDWFNPQSKEEINQSIRQIQEKFGCIQNPLSALSKP
jgi:hypothetical protein